MRRQFAEKSEVLAATRRELFATQEKFLALQKDQEEARINDESESIQSLKRLLAEAENELACTEQVHALEIDRLHEVVESLIMPVSLSSRG